MTCGRQYQSIVIKMLVFPLTLILVRDLFLTLRGDAVNVAARMEQSGLAGQIQVTRNVVDSAGSDFTFEFRGTLMVKG